MKDVNTAPMTKIRTPMNRINWLKTAFNPTVRVSDVDAIPTPKRLLNNRRNNVDATLNVKMLIVKLVCSLRRIKSLIGKPALLIFTRQFPLI